MKRNLESTGCSARHSMSPFLQHVGSDSIPRTLNSFPASYSAIILYLGIRLSHGCFGCFKVSWSSWPWCHGHSLIPQALHVLKGTCWEALVHIIPHLQWAESKQNFLECTVFFFFLMSKCIILQNNQQILCSCILNASLSRRETMKHFPVSSGSICIWKILQNTVQFANVDSSSLDSASPPKSPWWKNIFEKRNVLSLVIVRGMCNPFGCICMCPDLSSKNRPWCLNSNHLLGTLLLSEPMNFALRSLLRSFHPKCILQYLTF